MQELHLRNNVAGTTIVDANNFNSNNIPVLTRGITETLRVRIFTGTEADTLLTATDLADYVSWNFIIADDWNTATPPQLTASSISVTNNAIDIALTDTNTTELITKIGTAESVTLGGELTGFVAGQTAPVICLQFSVKVRNRRGDTGTGSPTPVGDGN